MTLLSTTNRASPGTFDVSSISGAYNDLILIVLARSNVSSGADGLYMRLNNDSGFNYYTEKLRANGTTATASEVMGSSSIGCGQMPGTSILANSFAVFTITIFGYAATTWFKTVQIQQAHQNSTSSGGYYLEDGGSTWESTAAITRVQFAGGGSFADNLVTNSQLRIYGRL